MANFNTVKNFQFAENKSSNGYIDPRDINVCESCKNLKYASKDDLKVQQMLVKFPNITQLVLRLETFLNNQLDLLSLSNLENLKIVIKNTSSSFVNIFKNIDIFLPDKKIDIKLKMSQSSANFDDLLEMAIRLEQDIEFNFREVECKNGFAMQFFDLQ